MAACAVVLWLMCCAFITLPKTDYTLTVYAGDAEYVFAYPEIDFCGDGLYIKNLDQAIERIYLDTAVRPKDAEMSFDPSAGPMFAVTPERAGREIDAAKLKEDILSAIAFGKAEVRAEFTAVEPKVRASDLWACTVLRGSFTTDYAASDSGRKHNISLAAEALSGTVIAGGEEFSFNLTVGERTEDRGYVEAKIIRDGKFENGLGGGVCQVSTTLYNAALVSGLNVSERHPHSIAVSYVEPSFDAMVSGSSCDLRLVNCTGGPVFIAAKADGSKLKISIYGRQNSYSVRRVSVTLKSVDPGYDVVEDRDGITGEEESRIVTRSKPEITSMGRLEYFSGGKLVKTLPLGRDCYRGVKGKILQKPPISQENGQNEG